jgi:hypothetical protein
MTVDPSATAMLFAIGPANALIYGILGLAIGMLSTQFGGGRYETLSTPDAVHHDPAVTHKPRS